MEQATYIIIGAIIGAIGSIVVAIINYFLNQRKQLQSQYNQIMEEKFRYILIIMACVLDFSRRKYFSVHEQYPATSSDDYFNILKEYYYHGLLYCSDGVQRTIKRFIENPSRENYIQTAKAMRKLLWKKKSKLTSEDVFLPK